MFVFCICVYNEIEVEDLGCFFFFFGSGANAVRIAGAWSLLRASRCSVEEPKTSIESSRLHQARLTIYHPSPCSRRLSLAGALQVGDADFDAMWMWKPKIPAN